MYFVKNCDEKFPKFDIVRKNLFVANTEKMSRLSRNFRFILEIEHLWFTKSIFRQHFRLSGLSENLR